MLKGDDSGGGSPLWMSPEALLEEPVITVKVNNKRMRIDENYNLRRLVILEI
jgi:hypothetical protein